MTTADPFEPARAHRYFAAHCFNRTWSLLDLPTRTPAETEQMLLLALASLWHWTQRLDCTGRELSVGYWLVARAYSVAGEADNAWQFAQRCLAASADQPPFHLGYAHEALARAAHARDERDRFALHLTEARKFAAAVTSPEERALLETDLSSLAPIP